MFEIREGNVIVENVVIFMVVKFCFDFVYFGWIRILIWSWKVLFCR